MHTNQTKSKTLVLTVKNKRENMKTASLCNKRNPTNSNIQKLKKVESELINAY